MNEFSIMKPKPNNFIRFLDYVRPYWKYVALGSIGGIVKFSASFFAHNRTGSVVSRLTSDVLQAQNLVGSVYKNFWRYS